MQHEYTERGAVDRLAAARYAVLHHDVDYAAIGWHSQAIACPRCFPQSSMVRLAGTIEMGVRVIRAELATPENAAPFGGWVGSAAGGRVGRSAFYGDTVELRKPAHFVGDDTIEITVATVHRRKLEVHWLERHFLHTQTFLPLGGRPFLMVMAPAGDSEMPDLDAARALLFDGTAGIALHLGTWHEFPMALVDSTDVVVLIRRDTVRDLAKSVGNEASGPDLDKKDIVSRTGVILQIALA